MPHRIASGSVLTAETAAVSDGALRDNEMALLELIVSAPLGHLSPLAHPFMATLLRRGLAQRYGSHWFATRAGIVASGRTVQ